MTRYWTLAPEEPAPSGAEAQFSTDFSKHTIPYSEVLSGGPPKDGIPAVDEPQFISVDEADAWIGPTEPVAALQIVLRREPHVDRLYRLPSRMPSQPRRLPPKHKRKHRQKRWLKPKQRQK